jgi:hypothetical protein
MIDRLVIYLLLAGCLIFGALVLTELQPDATDKAAPTQVSGRPNAAAATRRQPGTRIDELLATALARPLFSSTRRPPQSGASDQVVSSDLADTRLTGIVTEPGHHVAIFAVNGAKPLKLSEGEAVSGWKIESITPREVSLSGPGGTKTLEPKLDPNLVQTPGPTPAANPAARVSVPPAPGTPAAAVAPRVRPGLPAPPQVRPVRGRVQR